MPLHRLIVMRHARAESIAPLGGDRDRPLSAQGRADAARMGQALAERGLRPDRALVSGALRTHETWTLMHDALGDVEVRIDGNLYNASAGVLRASIEASEEDAGCLLILGHNPGVHDLAAEYLAESAASPAMLDRMAGGFPPGSAAVFTVDSAGRVSPEGFLTPQTLGGAGT